MGDGGKGVGVGVDVYRASTGKRGKKGLKAFLTNLRESPPNVNRVTRFHCCTNTIGKIFSGTLINSHDMDNFNGIKSNAGDVGVIFLCSV